MIMQYSFIQGMRSYPSGWERWDGFTPQKYYFSIYTIWVLLHCIYICMYDIVCVFICLYVCMYMLVCMYVCVVLYFYSLLRTSHMVLIDDVLMIFPFVWRFKNCRVSLESSIFDFCLVLCSFRKCRYSDIPKVFWVLMFFCFQPAFWRWIPELLSERSQDKPELERNTLGQSSPLFLYFVLGHVFIRGGYKGCRSMICPHKRREWQGLSGFTADRPLHG